MGSLGEKSRIINQRIADNEEIRKIKNRKFKKYMEYHETHCYYCRKRYTEDIKPVLYPEGRPDLPFPLCRECHENNVNA
ncbi:hypothetical protein P4I85_29635 [Bacillus cereus]|uniref:hypothetical protein n=1 Tax=Bacillus thuringiensis TaxID=1428 RepID=UPI001298BD72|nr:hypothetical protein [Bacillus cereus]MEB9593384.1 hypothetical protein [Bacillus cereus]MEC2467398.1 hypothetical protein [Bacillus cereus]MRC07860.1 hypothetical protein [Bacillus thuringiensis]MRD22185.1 hypothetical protein [Bacillus thuringiensis]